MNTQLEEREEKLGFFICCDKTEIGLQVLLGFSAQDFYKCFKHEMYWEALFLRV